MAFDPANLLPTPQGYATPDQIKAMYEYAKVLGQGDSQFKTISHPLQGMSNITNALMGGWLSNRANDLERGTRQYDSRSLPSAPEHKKEGENGGGEDKYANAISSIESSGNYKALGPVTKTGDKAYGRYQIMGANVGPWTKEVLGTAMSPQEFLHNQEAQDAVFNAKFGQYKQKYGPSGASRAWFAGEGGMNNPNTRDQLGTTVADYERKFNTAAGINPGQAPAPQASQAPQPPQVPQSGDDASATQFQGASSPMENMSGQEAIVNALAGGAGARAPTSPIQHGLPQPVGGTPPVIQPGLTPLRPQVNRQQFENIMSSSWLPPELKQHIYDTYMQQNQPLSVPYTGGNVLVSPNQPRNQQFIPDLKMVPTDVKGGEGTGISTQLPMVVQPGGGAPGQPNFNFRYIPQGGIPQGAPRPTPAPGGPGLAPSPAAPASPTQGLPNLLHYAPDDQGSVNPLAQMPQGLPPFAPKADAAPPTKEAQILPPQLMNEMHNLREFGLETEQRKKEIDQRTQQYAKVYKDRSAGADIAIRSMPQVLMARKIIDDPNFIAGFLADPRLDLARAKSFLSSYVNTNPNAAAATEMFEKLMSGNIVEDMKIMLQGLGQVRVAEINLLSKATGNRYNTVPANRAVLDVMVKTHQLAATTGQMASAYANGVRWDPKTGQAHQAFDHPTGLDYNWDRTLQQYMINHPLFTDAEINNYEKLFNESKSEPTPAIKKYGGTEGIAKTLKTAVHGDQAGTSSAPASTAPSPLRYDKDGNLQK